MLHTQIEHTSVNFENQTMYGDKGYIGKKSYEIVLPPLGRTGKHNINLSLGKKQNQKYP